jgi:CHAD domain-containing protein
MIKEALLSYFQAQQATVLNNWQSAKSEHDVDALHDLRVGIKRLKALYQVLDPLSGGKFEYKTHFEDIRQLFKAVGKLRDIQVQNRLFTYFAKETPLEDYKDFYRELQKSAEDESVQLKSALQSFKPQVMEDSINDTAVFLEGYTDKKAIKQTLKYLNKRLKQVKDLLPFKKDELLMHEMRSRVKQAYYIIELLKLMQPDLEAVEDAKCIKLAGELLGQWHDHAVLSDQIRNFLNEACEDDDFDSEPYYDILKRIKKEGNQLLKRGRKVLKALRLSVV